MCEIPSFRPHDFPDPSNKSFRLTSGREYPLLYTRYKLYLKVGNGHGPIFLIYIFSYFVYLGRNYFRGTFPFLFGLGAQWTIRFLEMGDVSEKVLTIQCRDFRGFAIYKRIGFPISDPPLPLRGYD